MELKIIQSQDKTLIEIIGSLDGSTSASAADSILAACENGCSLEIDLAQCGYVSSAGLRTLLTVGKSVKSQSGHMKLLNMSDDIADIMSMTGFDRIFRGLE